MMIEQTVMIPTDHRLVIDVPREVPTGKTILVFKPVAKAPRKPDKPMSPKEAIEYCDGLFLRLGIDLSGDKFLELRQQDREFEAMLDATIVTRDKEIKPAEKAEPLSVFWMQ